MPGFDGTGSMGMGPPWESGPGRGRGGGSGGSRRGWMGASRAGAGPIGECICPKCGATTTLEAGIPCYITKCPKSGTKMVRKWS